MSNAQDSHDLNEISERLEFCRSRIILLGDETDRYFKENLIITLADLSDGKVNVLGRLKSKLPISLRSTTGMIANEIRACLDALACKLAQQNGKSTSRVYFPISKSKDIFDKDGMNKIKKLSSEHKAEICKLKSYRKGNAALWHLHESDRLRKHLGLTPSFSVADMIFEGGIQIANCTDININGKSIYRVNSGALNEKADTLLIERMSKDFSVTIQPKIQFTGHEDLKGLNHQEVLSAALSASTTIVNTFM